MSSANYQELTTPEQVQEAIQLVNAWKDPNIPERQWKAIEGERRAIDEGRLMEVAPFRAFVKSCESLPYDFNDEAVALLDVGASSGYYSEVLRAAGYEWNYTALDYSEAFEAFAEKVLPHVKFVVGDALDLPYEDNAFNVVVSGCCIIHIHDWKRAIKESTRVAKDYVIFHRTPILAKKSTTIWKKTAYDVPTIELWFNSAEFLEEVAKAGLSVEAIIPVFTSEDFGGFGHYNFVCCKK